MNTNTEPMKFIRHFKVMNNIMCFSHEMKLE